MKDIDILSSSSSTFKSAVEAAAAIASDQRSLEGIIARQPGDMFQLPPPDKKQDSILNDKEIFGDPFESTIDYCDNDAQFEVLRHHYLNEFGLQCEDDEAEEEEILKDYREDSVIHKVVDDMPSTYRGRSGAIHAWHDLYDRYLKGGRRPCHFDLTHISVCKNHAQVYWKAEGGPKRVTLHGTDSFTFDETNHIKMQTTVALSEN